MILHIKTKDDVLGVGRGASGPAPCEGCRLAAADRADGMHADTAVGLAQTVGADLGLADAPSRGTYTGVNGKGGEYRLGPLFRSDTISVGNRYGPIEVPRCKSTTGDTEWT